MATIRTVTTNLVPYCWIGGYTTIPGRSADTGWYPFVTDRRPSTPSGFVSCLHFSGNFQSYLVKHMSIAFLRPETTALATGRQKPRRSCGRTNDESFLSGRVGGGVRAALDAVNQRVAGPGVEQVDIDAVEGDLDPVAFLDSSGRFGAHE